MQSHNHPTFLLHKPTTLRYMYMYMTGLHQHISWIKYDMCLELTKQTPHWHKVGGLCCACIYSIRFYCRGSCGQLNVYHRGGARLQLWGITRICIAHFLQTLVGQRFGQSLYCCIEICRFAQVYFQKCWLPVLESIKIKCICLTVLYKEKQWKF